VIDPSWVQNLSSADGFRLLSMILAAITIVVTARAMRRHTCREWLFDIWPIVVAAVTLVTRALRILEVLIYGDFAVAIGEVLIIALLALVLALVSRKGAC
jgi:hypothetical protein